MQKNSSEISEEALDEIVEGEVSILVGGKMDKYQGELVCLIQNKNNVIVGLRDIMVNDLIIGSPFFYHIHDFSVNFDFKTILGLIKQSK